MINISFEIFAINKKLCNLALKSCACIESAKKKILSVSSEKKK